MAKHTWSDAIDEVQQDIAYGVLVYPFEVLGEMLKDAFTFGSPSSSDHQQSGSGGCHCNCESHKR
jgi:hypothetical protein